MSCLDVKRTLIAGGTTRIGVATATALLEEGARVIVTGLNPDTMEAARSALGRDVPVIATDAARPDEQRRLANLVSERYGQLDILFVNAGISVWQPIEARTEELLDRSFAVNVKGPFFLMQALLPVFARPASGVLNTSGVA